MCILSDKANFGSCFPNKLSSDKMYGAERCAFYPTRQAMSVIFPHKFVIISRNLCRGRFNIRPLHTTIRCFLCRGRVSRPAFSHKYSSFCKFIFFAIYTKHHLKFGKNQADNLAYIGFRRRFFPLFYWCLVL